jgi:hypothetical protein
VTSEVAEVLNRLTERIKRYRETSEEDKLTKVDEAKPVPAIRDQNEARCVGIELPEGERSPLLSSLSESNDMHQYNPLTEQLIQTEALLDGETVMKNEHDAVELISKVAFVDNELQIKQSTYATEESIESIIERDVAVHPIDLKRDMSEEDFVKILEGKVLAECLHRLAERIKGYRQTSDENGIEHVHPFPFASESWKLQILSSLSRESRDPEVIEVLHRLAERNQGNRQQSDEDSVDNTHPLSFASESWKLKLLSSLSQDFSDPEVTEVLHRSDRKNQG